MSTQLTAEDLVGMSPEEIMAAKHEGRLNALLGRPADINSLAETIESER